jgi:hypothetical protein
VRRSIGLVVWVKITGRAASTQPFECNGGAHTLTRLGLQKFADKSVGLPVCVACDTSVIIGAVTAAHVEDDNAGAYLVVDVDLPLVSDDAALRQLPYLGMLWSGAQPLFFSLMSDVADKAIDAYSIVLADTRDHAQRT